MMTDEEGEKVLTVVTKLRGLHVKQNKTLAQMLRLVVQVLEPSPYWDLKKKRRIAKDKAALPDTLRDLIKMLEGEE